MSKYNKFIFGLVIGVILVGAIVPFGAQFLLPFFYPDIFVGGAEVWNQYVSIVLGVVATILSVVSLKMCFISEETSRQTELRTQKTLDRIDARIQLLSQRQDQLYNAVSQNSQNTKVNNIDKTTWETFNRDDNNMILDEDV